MPTITPRARSAIIKSLRAGVTPQIGLEHIQVGRVREIKAIGADLEAISQGASAFRLIIGDYGAGKSFFLHLIKYVALQKNLVVLSADLTPDRRLYGGNGQAVNLYRELLANLSTRALPQGNALGAVIEAFISAQRRAAAARGITPEAQIEEQLVPLTELVGGFDFAQAIRIYWQAINTDDELKKQAVWRYLRGEYTRITDSRRDLGLATIVRDDNIYAYLKILARFVALAGYRGLLINIDEAVNLYKLPTITSRQANYEQLLRIVNDCLQGTAIGLGFVFGGTPEFLTDPRKGLYSYQALRSRLEENPFAAAGGTVDYQSPVLRLSNLNPEELYVLLANVRNVFAGGDPQRYLVPDAALEGFLKHCAATIGAAYFRTPRQTIKSFTDMLSVIEQNPQLQWSDLIAKFTPAADRPDNPVAPPPAPAGGDAPQPRDDDALSDFQL